MEYLLLAVWRLVSSMSRRGSRFWLERPLSIKAGREPHFCIATATELWSGHAKVGNDYGIRIFRSSTKRHVTDTLRSNLNRSVFRLEARRLCRQEVVLGLYTLVELRVSKPHYSGTP